MDIIVTTPKDQMKAAAQEAGNCIADGGGQYFRRFNWRCEPSNIDVGDRIYYVEDGYIRGFAIVANEFYADGGMICDTTGRPWPKGYYVVMDAKSWQWIESIPLRGFQGFQYAEVSGAADGKTWITLAGQDYPVKIVGGWLDPKPEVKE